MNVGFHLKMLKTLSRWETGKQVPDALMIPEIAKALDISIPEIYGVAYTNNEYIVQSERIDYSRVTSYKFISMLALLMFVVGDGIYSRTGMYWHYMKVGAIILLVFSILLFWAAEVSFREFYIKTSNSDIYGDYHMKWLASVVPITGFLAGVIIPICKSQAITMFNHIDVLFPLVVFQGGILILNYNLRTKVTYRVEEIPMHEINNYDQNLISWIQECNVIGKEVNIKNSYRYDEENENNITSYLIYMPHGYKDTDLKVTYYWGIGGKVLKLDFRNTTPFIDDNYYL